MVEQGATAAALQAGHSAPVAAGTKEISGFSHLVLEVKDLDRAERFYQDVIGLELMGRGLLAEPRAHSLMRMNTGQFILLIQHDSPVPIRHNTTTIHHAFLLTIEEFQAAKQRFDAAGYDVSDNRAAFRARGEYSIDIWDPDGHRWQVQAFGPEQHDLIKPGTGVVDCGLAEKYELGSVTSFGKAQFFLVHAKEGFLALSRWCRHANGLLSYQGEHWRFFCAFHGATYNLRGDHTGHMAGIPPLRMHPVTLSPEGHVLVDTDAVLERDSGTLPEYAPCQAAPAPAR